LCSAKREAELARYQGVLHLRTPRATDGYNHSNPLRIPRGLSNRLMTTHGCAEALAAQGSFLEMRGERVHSELRSSMDPVGAVNPSLLHSWMRNLKCHYPK
jgi:hypothetical protein